MIKSWLVKNFFYKITSLLLALTLWYVVRSEEIIEISKTIRVEVLLPQDKTLRGERFFYREASLRGSRSQLKALNEQVLEAKVQLNHKKTGPLKFRLDKQHILGLDPKVKLIIHDPHVHIVVDPKAVGKG